MFDEQPKCVSQHCKWKAQVSFSLCNTATYTLSCWFTPVSLSYVFLLIIKGAIVHSIHCINILSFCWLQHTTKSKCHKAKMMPNKHPKLFNNCYDLTFSNQVWNDLPFLSHLWAKLNSTLSINEEKKWVAITFNLLAWEKCGWSFTNQMQITIIKNSFFK